jgi:DNA repair protein RecO (recombination protein O)
VARILTTEAICLRSQPWRETSKFLSVFTPDYGRLMLRAKGARRPESKFGAALEIFTHSRIIFYQRETRPVHTLSDAAILDEFATVRHSPARLLAATIMLEFTHRCFEPESPNRPVFQLLLEALRGINEREGEFTAVAFSYLFRAAGRMGYEPQLRHCNLCQRPRAATFSPRLGGLLCRQCLPRDPTSVPLTAPVLRSLHRLYYGGLAENLRHAVSPDLRALVLRYLQYHFEGLELRALRFLA